MERSKRFGAAFSDNCSEGEERKSGIKREQEKT
jgi:hypothetical protein